MDTATLVSTVSPTINLIGAAFYFTPETVAVGKEKGLDGFRFYILGRGGVLGDAEAPVVTSAFGWWNPGLIAKMWNSGREIMAPREAGRLYMSCAHTLGRAKFANVGGLDAFNAAAEKVIAAADPAALSLFAGIAAEPLADDAPARAMQNLAVLRELRGSIHLVAVLSTGLSPKLAHAIKRPDMVKSFGWGDEAPATTDADAAKLADAEAITDRLIAPAYSVLNDAERDALAAGVAACAAALQS
jgi:hypothetical protein